MKVINQALSKLFNFSELAQICDLECFAPILHASYCNPHSQSQLSGSLSRVSKKPPKKETREFIRMPSLDAHAWCLSRVGVASYKGSSEDAHSDG